MSDQLTAPQLLYKQPTEKLIFTTDFSARISTGVTISSITSVVGKTVDGETDSSLLITSSQISGKKVLYFIDGGTNAKSYKIEVTILLSTGETLVGTGMLRVIDV